MFLGTANYHNLPMLVKNLAAGNSEKCYVNDRFANMPTYFRYRFCFCRNLKKQDLLSFYFLFVAFRIDIILLTGLFILVDGNYIPEIPYIELICSVVIIAREFMIGVLRQVAALKNVVLAADKLGKIKTATTMFGLTYIILLTVSAISV